MKYNEWCFCFFSFVHKQYLKGSLFLFDFHYCDLFFIQIQSLFKVLIFETWEDVMSQEWREREHQIEHKRKSDLGFELTFKVKQNTPILQLLLIFPNYHQ